MITPRFNVTIARQEGNFTEFVCEPLERGFGHTIGNSLRRVLLSSIPGAAITSVKIKGVDHQFSTLKGVQEDVVDILLNLKEVMVHSDVSDASTMKLSVTGGVATAGDIQCPTGIEIANPDFVLAHLNEKTTLEMEMVVEQGVGMSAAESREVTDLAGQLLVDAVFSPIRRVAYSVEETRVGNRTDFDRLILHMWTNGTVEPREVLNEASEILIRHFQQVINPENIIEKSEVPAVRPADEVSRLTIEELDLPTRIANALRKGGYSTVGDLSKAAEPQVAMVKNLGGKSVTVVAEALEKVGASFHSESAEK